MKQKKIIVIGPDELPLRPEPFNSRSEAEAYAVEWCKRYKQQGYYSAVDGRIPLDVLPRCIEYVEDDAAAS